MVKPNERPYAKYAESGGDTIHVAYTNAHPNEFPSVNVYYARIRAGQIERAGGQPIGTLAGAPIAPEAGDLSSTRRNRPGCTTWQPTRAATRSSCSRAFRRRRPPLPLRALDGRRLAGQRDHRRRPLLPRGAPSRGLLLGRADARPRGPLARLSLPPDRRELAGGDLDDTERRGELDSAGGQRPVGREERPPGLAARDDRLRRGPERHLDARRLPELRGLPDLDRGVHGRRRRICLPSPTPSPRCAAGPGRSRCASTGRSRVTPTGRSRAGSGTSATAARAAGPRSRTPIRQPGATSRP